MIEPLPPSRARRAVDALLPLLLGVAVTLVLRGYQYGGGNHCVYLIAPLREVEPGLLANDWWTTHTLQYHVAYTKLAAALMRLGVIEPAFLCFYVALVVLLHVGWRRIAIALGLDSRAYVLSVVLYYLSAGGTGLGSYQFLQDSSFLPGNVANVAMLWGLVCYVEGRPVACAVALAVAGLFHLNHAIVALLFFPGAYVAPRLLRRTRAHAHGLGTLSLCYAVIVLFALPNLIPAVRVTLAGGPKMPLGDFVDLYVHLRHPHHYDPLTWPAALWLSFVWPVPLAVVAYRRQRHARPAIRAGLAGAFFLALQLIALLLAGVLFVSEPLIQMSLFRFSIYPKLLTCVGAAAFLLGMGKAVKPALLALPVIAAVIIVALRLAQPQSLAGLFVVANLTPLLIFTALLAASAAYTSFHPPSSIIHPRFSLLIPSLLVLLMFGWGRWLGLHVNLADDADGAYTKVCAFARTNTPPDALFVVPPNEQLFRFQARRAVVVNFKNVPQLSREMPEWRDRLEAVLGQPLSTLPKRFDLAHAAIARQYDDRPTVDLVTAAKKYGARYLVTTCAHPTLRVVFDSKPYYLYDLSEGP